MRLEARGHVNNIESTGLLDNIYIEESSATNPDGRDDYIIQDASIRLIHLRSTYGEIPTDVARLYNRRDVRIIVEIDEEGDE